MAKADLSTPRPLRIAIAVVIVLIHVAVFFGLMRALAPGFTQAALRGVTTAITITATPAPTPTPKPVENSRAPPDEEGAEGEAGRKATPREVTAPAPRIRIAEAPAPRASSTGIQNTSGARETGEGTGAGSQGSGTGAGDAGAGHGGGGSGGGTKAEKISGEIRSAKDYPRTGRDLRIGDHVIIAMTVGTDGRARNCHVVRPSRDPQADRITCDLAERRFRFRPATGANGEPVESVYGWKQRWFYRDER